MNFDPLCKPFDLKSLHLPNRIVMAPMTRSMSKHNIPGKDVAAYYQRRAEGGVGLIISEGTAIDHPAIHGYPDVPNFYGEDALKGWKTVIDAVHQAGSKMFPQLWHVGSVRQCKTQPKNVVDNQASLPFQDTVPGYAPSAIAHPYIKNGEIPHEMSKEDIKEVVDSFARAAKNAKNLGFDGVEIHGAHGYLIDQFFWDVTNKRTDEYGGKTAAERTRFAVEIIEAIRNIVGPDYPIMLRFSQFKLGAYEAKLNQTPEELKNFLTPLSAAGVDIFHCSTRSFAKPEFEGSTLNLAGWTKKLSNKPVVTVGSVGLDVDFIKTFMENNGAASSKKNLEYLLECFERGEYDLVAVGRALLADPQWFQKVKNGEFDKISPFSKNLLTTLY